jgi:calcineurin-like phosphoesterase
MDTETGEFGERRLEHGEGGAEKFYRDLQQAGIRMEATGHARWFERDFSTSIYPDHFW